MNIFFIGSPGSGKGTQAQRLVSEKKFKHLSTGDIFRKNFKEKTEIGLQAQKYMDQGQLVPDDITVKMVELALKEIPEDVDIIFDGFPRNVFQGKALDKILKERGQKVDLILYFEVSDSKVIERLTGRLWAPKSGCIYHIKTNPPKVAGRCDETGEFLVTRKDDKKEVVLARLKVFWKDTHPLLHYYERQGNLKRIDGEKSPDKIFETISYLLENSN